jgi:hypothetical protein
VAKEAWCGAHVGNTATTLARQWQRKTVTRPSSWCSPTDGVDTAVCLGSSARAEARRGAGHAGGS